MPIRPVTNPHAEPPPEEGEFDLSQLSDPEDEEELEDELEATAPEPEPDPDPTPPKRKGGRPRKPQEQKPVGVGVAAKEPTTYFKNRNLEVLWPEVLEYLRQQHRSPWDVDIRVKRTEPQEMLIGQPFNGGTVMGADGRAASTQIVDKITDDYHMLSGAVGPASYKVEILWRVNSKVLTWGIIRLASPDAIMGMRRAQSQQQPAPPMPWHGPHYPPPPSYAQYQPPPASSYAGYGAPPQSHGSSESTESMRAELGYLRGTLDEVLRAQREGRQPNIQPPPGTASTMPSVEDIARRVVEMLRPTGLGAPVVATPNVVPPTPAVSTFESSVQSIMQSMIQGTLKKVAGSIDQAIRGDGTPPPPEAAAEVIDPKDELPFDMIALDSKWPDGRPVYFPKKKENGTIDWMGVLAGNPFLVEKMSDSVSGLVGSVGDVIKNLGRTAIPGAAEVVTHIPRGAVQAGMGQPQQPQVSPYRPAPQASSVVPSNGAGASVPPPSNGGWPTG